MHERAEQLQPSDPAVCCETKLTREARVSAEFSEENSDTDPRKREKFEDLAEETTDFTMISRSDC